MARNVLDYVDPAIRIKKSWDNCDQAFAQYGHPVG